LIGFNALRTLKEIAPTLEVITVIR